MNMLAPKRKSFDYNGLPDNHSRATLRKEAASIKLAVKRTHDNIIEIGNRLIHAKEVAGHGKFLDWIDAEFRMSDRHALNFMRVAEKFGKSENISDLNLPNSALFMLAAPSISDETREIIMEEAQAGNVKTMADVKEWVEAAKPIISTSETPAYPPDDDLGDEAEFVAETIIDDEEFPDPFADECEDEAENFEEQAEPESHASVSIAAPAKPTTLKERAKNAEVIHDTLSNAVEPDELSEEDWLKSLPIFRVLSQKQHRGIFLKRDLIAARTLGQHQSLFAHHAKRALDFKAPSGTYFSRAVIGLASMPAPMDWQVCAPCKGNGCQRCAHAGYDTTGAGISAMRVESGEVVL